MDKVYLDYDIGMVHQVYNDNEMHRVCHNQSWKIDRMEQYLDFQLSLCQCLVDDEVMDYFDDNLVKEMFVTFNEQNTFLFFFCHLPNRPL